MKSTAYYCPRCRNTIVLEGRSQPVRLDICPTGFKDNGPDPKQVRMRRLKRQPEWLIAS